MKLGDIFKRVVFGKPKPRVFTRYQKLPLFHGLIGMHTRMVQRETHTRYTVQETGIATERWRVIRWTAHSLRDDDLYMHHSPETHFELEASRIALRKGGLTADQAVQLLKNNVGLIDRITLHRKLKKKSRFAAPAAKPTL